MMIRLSSMKIALLIGTIYGKLTGEDIKAVVKKVLTPINLEHTITNPLFGYIFRANGCLESIRFYSSELEVEYNATGERIYFKDKTNDPLTNLLIQLFPSHTGVLNNFRGTDSNFTNMYFIKNKGQLERIAYIKMLGNTFAGLVRKQDDKKPQKVSKKKDIYRLFEYYMLSSSTVPGLDDKVQKLLAIQAYAVETFDTPEELETYLNSILDNTKDTKNVIHSELSDEQKMMFEVLYANPFNFPYSKINQPVSNSSIPIYYRKSNTYDKDKKFADCVDITILNLCNCLFYNSQMGSCSLDHLELTGSDRLKEFYEKYHYKPFGVTEEMRNEWSRVVQGLDDNKAFACQDSYKPYMIHYIKEEYRNEIKSGFFNTMSVLANICGVNDVYRRIMTKGTISKDSVGEKLTEFFNEISNENVKVIIAGDGIKKIAQNNVSDFTGDFYMTLYLKYTKTSVTMKLSISERHTSFFFEDMKSEQEEIDFTALESLRFDSNNFLLSFLISRYTKLLNNKDDKTVNFDYPFEALYNQGVLHTNEQKRDQCIHLCEFVDKNETFDHKITKRIINNIVKSANLSDPATREIFKPFIIYIEVLFAKMSSYEVLETWLSFFSKKSIIRSQHLKNAWNEAIKKSLMKIRSMTVSNEYTDSIDNSTKRE